MKKLRCSSCRRQFAWGPSYKGAVYCGSWCAHIRHTSDFEVRDATMAHLHAKNSERWNSVALALEFDLSRQRVDQVLTERRVLSSRRPQRAVGGDPDVSGLPGLRSSA